MCFSACIKKGTFGPLYAISLVHPWVISCIYGFQVPPLRLSSMCCDDEWFKVNVPFLFVWKFGSVLWQYVMKWLSRYLRVAYCQSHSNSRISCYPLTINWQFPSETWKRGHGNVLLFHCNVPLLGFRTISPCPAWRKERPFEVNFLLRYFKCNFKMNDTSLKFMVDLFANLKVHVNVLFPSEENWSL